MKNQSQAKLKHVWQDSQWGVACYGCGIMQEVSKTEACDGPYWDLKIGEVEAEIEKLNKTRDSLLRYRALAVVSQ